MTLGQVFGLCGMYKVWWMRSEWPWLVPVHIALYLTHMAQEIYDVSHATRPVADTNRQW